MAARHQNLSEHKRSAVRGSILSRSSEQSELEHPRQSWRHAMFSASVMAVIELIRCVFNAVHQQAWKRTLKTAYTEKHQPECFVS